MMSKQCHISRICSLFQLAVASTVIILVGGGAALLWQLQQGHLAGATTIITRSNDVSIVSPPSLPAATVDAIFKTLGSPMLGTGKAVEQASRQANIDDAFALAVWWTETNDGETGVGRADLNPGSVRGSIGYPSAYDGYTIYPSYTAAINYWFYLLKNRYVDRGLSTVYSISHPYVGTPSSPLWAGKVMTRMLQYRGVAPPPPQPTPTLTHQAPSPAVSASLLRLRKILSAANLAFDSGSVALNRQVGVERSARARSTTPLGQDTTTLSPGIELAIVFFALLAALGIALWGLRMGRNLNVPLSQQLSPITPVSVPTIPGLPRQNTGRSTPIRRIILLPFPSDAAAPGKTAISRATASSLSTGLLSRYGEAREVNERH
jgi:hypothetical protein